MYALYVAWWRKKKRCKDNNILCARVSLSNCKSKNKRKQNELVSVVLVRCRKEESRSQLVVRLQENGDHRAGEGISLINDVT